LQKKSIQVHKQLKDIHIYNLLESDHKPKMSVSAKYRKLEQREHVLSRPSMYIGSIDNDEISTWVWDDQLKKIVFKKIAYNAGLYKIYDEILVNAIDHYVRMTGICKTNLNAKPVKNIKVTIDRNIGSIEIFNDGDGIDVEMHTEYNVYIPELIFGSLLTSTNYDDEEERTIGGQNGIGAKACNIFSTEFLIETIDYKKGKLYKQRFYDNMSKKDVPTISSTKKLPYTLIKFIPDYKKFGMECLSDDMYAMMIKRACDIAAVTDKSVSVTINSEKLPHKMFTKYVELYNDLSSESFVDKPHDRLEIIVLPSSTGFQQVSFVNGICTIKGGKHVDAVVNHIVKGITETIKKKKKVESVKPHLIKEQLAIFINATITNPSFDSQSKEYLTTPVSKFGCKIELSEAFIAKLSKSSITEAAIVSVDATEQKEAKKTDGRKSSVIRGIDKLEDAAYAGTSKSSECTLILTEGESAKSMAITGLSQIGREFYGVFPLRGKILNVKDVSVKKILENEEISYLKKIIGLESGKVYKDISSLRYGRVMVMTDQDLDGSHIKGLLFNVFHTLWPSLLQHPAFMTSLLTPIVKARSKNVIMQFYNLTDYENWKITINDQTNWKVKYYKGLGSSGNDEAKEYFANMQLINYKHSGIASDHSIELAFNKKLSEDRKHWLSQYDKQHVLTLNTGSTVVTYEEFVDKDLIHFSNHDNHRSIPSVIDGMKVSQRKIMYGCFKKNLVNEEIRVAQLAAYVSEQSSYHHGETSLQGAITAMAQDFVGSNNINLLKPIGQFGTRLMGGKDAGSPRYIHTILEPIVNKLFRKEDLPILNYLNDDGYPIEPELYVPIIPVVLINGTVGIGTGFSTNIPCFNPSDIITLTRSLVTNSDTLPDLKPWYRGYEGVIDGEFSKGLWHRESDDVIVITELPIGTWTDDYKSFLEFYIEKHPNILKHYESHMNTHVIINFRLIFYSGVFNTNFSNTEVFEKEFKLVQKNMTTTNMHLINTQGAIKKYATPLEIANDYMITRKEFYNKRKDYDVARLERELMILRNKKMFVESIVNNTLLIMKRSRVDIETDLKEQSFDTIDGNYNYLLNMSTLSFTLERIDELQTDFQNVSNKLIIYKNTTIEQLWLKELDELQEAYDIFLQEYEDMLQRQKINNNSSINKCAKKKRVAKS